MAVRTRLVSLFPLDEGMKEEREGRPNALRGVIAWHGRCVVVIVQAARSDVGP